MASGGVSGVHLNWSVAPWSALHACSVGGAWNGLAVVILSLIESLQLIHYSLNSTEVIYMHKMQILTSG